MPYCKRSQYRYCHTYCWKARDCNLYRSSTPNPVAKSINGQQESLTNEEKAQVQHFSVRPTPQEPVEGSNAGKRRNYASRLRDRKHQRLTVCEGYPDLRFIAVTSASAERPFSSAKHVLRSTRKRLTPVNFEKLLFLKHNRHLWNADMVAQAMKTRDTTEN